MDKLKMAHDWAMKYGSPENFKLTVDEAWEYADAMQAEADKRKQVAQGECTESIKSKARGLVIPASLICSHHHVISSGECLDCGSFLPKIDWSQAPKDAFGWKMVGDNEAAWVSFHTGEFYLEDAPTFGYTGAWQDSLRKRPNT